MLASWNSSNAQCRGYVEGFWFVSRKSHNWTTLMNEMYEFYLDMCNKNGIKPKSSITISVRSLA